MTTGGGEGEFWGADNKNVEQSDSHSFSHLLAFISILPQNNDWHVLVNKAM